MNGSLDQVLSDTYDEKADTVEETTAEDSTQVEQPAEGQQPEGEAPNAEEAGQPTKPEETPQPTEQEQETFTHVDPKTLPPELQGVYRNLLKDYTQKRQAESAKVRELEEKIAEMEQSFANPQQAAQNGQLYTGDLSQEQLEAMTLTEYTAWLKQQMQQEFAQQQTQAEVAQFEQEAPMDFLSLDDRFNHELPTFDPRMAQHIAGQMDADLAAYIEANGTHKGFDVKAAAEKHIQEWDAWLASLRKTNVQETAQATRAKAQQLRRSAPATTSATSKPTGKMSLDQAISAAYAE